MSLTVKILIVTTVTVLAIPVVIYVLLWSRARLSCSSSPFVRGIERCGSGFLYAIACTVMAIVMFSIPVAMLWFFSYMLVLRPFGVVPITVLGLCAAAVTLYHESTSSRLTYVSILTGALLIGVSLLPQARSYARYPVLFTSPAFPAPDSDFCFRATESRDATVTFDHADPAGAIVAASVVQPKAEITRALGGTYQRYYVTPLGKQKIGGPSGYAEIESHWQPGEIHGHVAPIKVSPAGSFVTISYRVNDKAHKDALLVTTRPLAGWMSYLLVIGSVFGCTAYHLVMSYRAIRSRM